MRKLLMVLTLAAFTLAPLSAFAAFNGPETRPPMPPAKGPAGPHPFPAGGFIGPFAGAQADNVAKAMQLENGAPVVLTGNIVAQMADKKDIFIFRDHSGEIRVKIGKKEFAGQSLTPQDTILIVGEVEKNYGKDVKIDVKQLRILK